MVRRRKRSLPQPRSRPERRPSPEPLLADHLLGAPDASVLDLLDHLLTKGVMLNADVTLGVAGIDLIYLRLSALLAAFDRIFGESDWPATAHARRRRLKHALDRRR